ncbi:MAG: hypothetical protein JXR03_09095 [Cyclobacteriaceae bacterium]
MKKLIFSLFVLVGTLSGYSQKSLLVTDFVFFNNCDLPDYFKLDPEKLDSIKSFTIDVLKEQYGVTSFSFNEGGVRFAKQEFENSFDMSDIYRDQHKKLIKKGGYDLYLRLYIDVSVFMQSDNKVKYHFGLQTKISNKNGKKVFSRISKAPFQSLFPSDYIGSPSLISSDQFYTLFKEGIGVLYDKEKTKFDGRRLVRQRDIRFDDFISESQKLTLRKYRSLNAELVYQDGTIKTIKSRSGFESENEKIGLLSDEKDLKAKFKVKNPMLSEDWKITIKSTSKRLLDILEVSDIDASIKIDSGEETRANFELNSGEELVGNIGDQEYRLLFDDKAFLMESYVDGELKMLCQSLGNEKSTDLNVFADTKDEKLFGTLLNLHQVFYLAINTALEVQGEND